MMATENLLRYAGEYVPPWGVYAGKSYKPNGDFPYYTFQFCFSPDGLKLFTLRNPHFVGVYDLSSAWDIATASYSYQKNALHAYAPSGFLFSPDGIYAFSSDAYDNLINRSKMSSAWDISTMGYDQQVQVDFNIGDLFISPDGKKLFAKESTSSLLRQYAMSEAWDISTMAYVGSAALPASDCSIFFDPSGKYFYVRNRSKNRIEQYAMGEAWDISTMTKKTRSVKLYADGYDFFIDPSGTRMYTMTSGTSPVVPIIHQYDIPQWPK